MKAPNVTIRPATPADAVAWERLRCALWPDGVDDHAREIAMFFSGHAFKDLTAVLVAETETGAMVGVAELSVRDDILGLEGKRTGYVEGLYVTPEFRHTGLAQKMLQASRTWAREQNCVAFGSDRAERIIIDNSFTA